MPVFTVPIHEFNQCHEPGGQPAGGRFCSASTGTIHAGDDARFRELKTQWAQINNDLLAYVDRPNSLEAMKKLDQLKAICKEMYSLQADPGGTAGIGLPGGPRDIVVVGAGPGGLAAAVMGATDGLDTMLVDANMEVGGQAKFSSRIENYPGFPPGVTGENLANRMFDQATRLGAEAQLGVRVTGLSYDEKTGLKTLTMSNGTSVEARSVVIAGGVEFRKMDFPGANSPNVVYGDGQELSRQGAGGSVVVIGGSNGAAQAALGAARNANHVYVVSRSAIVKSMSDYQVNALRSNPKVTVIEGDSVASLQGSTLTTASGRTLPSKAVGIFIGGGPNLSWLPKTIKTANGRVAVNVDLETSIPGVFAVGDIRQGSIGRIGAAVGDGQIAERSVFQYFSRGN